MLSHQTLTTTYELNNSPHKNEILRQEMTAFHRCTGVAVVVLLSTLCLYQTPKGANEERRRLTGTWVDPRTTVGKATSIVSSTGVESLRFAAFGTSKTWGAGLKDPNNEVRRCMLSRLSVHCCLDMWS